MDFLSTGIGNGGNRSLDSCVSAGSTRNKKRVKREERTMKKLWILLLASILFLFAGCLDDEPEAGNGSDTPTGQVTGSEGSSSANDTSGTGDKQSSGSTQARDVLQLLIDGGLNIDMDSLIEIDESNDPEGLFGPDGYAIEKIAFTDKDVPDGVHEFIIIVFEDRKGMEADIEQWRDIKEEQGLVTTSVSYGVVTIRMHGKAYGSNSEYAEVFYNLDGEDVGERPFY